jgi:hypothetical protein
MHCRPANRATAACAMAASLRLFAEDQVRCCRFSKPRVILLTPLGHGHLKAIASVHPGMLTKEDFVQLKVPIAFFPSSGEAPEKVGCTRLLD